MSYLVERVDGEAKGCGLRRALGVEPLSRAAWQRVEWLVFERLAFDSFERLERRERSGVFPALRQRPRVRRVWLMALLVAGVSLLGALARFS